MNKLTEYKKFTYNGRYDREKEDFTYTIFYEYDFSQDKLSTSFFRSDFRGARFDKIHFYKNNFDRADFISCTFTNSIFTNVNIAACEIKNCFFEKSTFCGNFYNNTSIQECVFKDCEFKDENFLINMKNCKFINCKFNNIKFERSTTELIVFNSCNICNTDFANMHAERYKFVSCSLKDVLIDACYIYGYLFFDTNFCDIKIIYMGEIVNFTEENILYKFAAKLWSQSRFYEFINAYIVFGHKNDIKYLLEKAFGELLREYSPQRNLEIYNLLDMMQFYISNNIFSFSAVKSIIEYLDNLDISSLSFEEKITYMSQFEKIKTYLFDIQYDNDFVKSANGNISFVTFYCNTNDYQQAFNTVRKIIYEVYQSLGIEDKCILVDAQQGSWILTFVVASSCALLLPKIIKATSNIYFDLNTKRKISKRISDKLEKKQLSTSELKELTDIAIASGLVRTDLKEVDLKDISKIVEMIKIGI